MNSGEINTVKDNIGKLQSFPEGADAKTVTEWAQFVQDKWDTLDTTTKEELATTLNGMFSTQKSYFYTKFETVFFFGLQHLLIDCG